MKNILIIFGLLGSWSVYSAEITPVTNKEEILDIDSTELDSEGKKDCFGTCKKYQNSSSDFVVATTSCAWGYDGYKKVCKAPDAFLGGYVECECTVVVNPSK